MSKSQRIAISRDGENYFPALCFAHRARCAAAMRARAASLILRFFGSGFTAELPKFTLDAPFLSENLPSARWKGEFLP